MPGFLKTFILIGYFVALVLPPLAHGNHEQTQARLQLYQDQNPCNEPAQCLRTSGCDSQHNTRAPSLLPLPRFSLEHMSGLMREFNYTILSFISMFEDAQRTWQEDGPSVSVSERGLQNLYPLSRDTDVLTGSSSEDVHRVLRECMWFMTSVEAHVQRMHIANMIGASTGTLLVRKARQTSRALKHILNVFSVEGLPEQVFCIRSSRQMPTSETTKAKFTSMVLRDAHRALLRMYGVLSSCVVQPHHTGRHLAKLNCGPSHVSAFYTHVPEDIVYLYSASNVLATFT